MIKNYLKLISHQIAKISKLRVPFIPMQFKFLWQSLIMYKEMMNDAKISFTIRLMFQKDTQRKFKNESIRVSYNNHCVGMK